MATATTTQEIRLEAVDVYFGTKHCRTVTTVADAAGSLDGTYFDLNIVSVASSASDSFLSETLGYVYFGTDPSISGKTGYQASITTGDDAATVAAAIETALASVDVTVTRDGDTLTIENKYIGEITAETDSGSTGFTLAVAREAVGSLAGLGKTAQGGTTITLETQTFEAKSDQTGEIVLDDISLGNAVSAEVGLIELTKSVLGDIIGSIAGNTHTPSAGTELIGFGESRLYDSFFNNGGSLILHPIRKDSNDHSFDAIIHKCAPLPQDINYSGTENQVLNVTFKAYLDETVDTKINLFAIGDWTQDLA